jgi:hypothetical protein
MNLTQLVEFLKEADLPVTANYFNGCAKDSVTVDGLIEFEFVKRHIGEGMLLRSIQANVTTYVGCYMDKEKCETCNYESGHHSHCPENFSNSDSYQYQECQQ